MNDWWGTSVYSVDYQGNHRRDYGGGWDIQFEGGWLILTSFHTDVRPESLRVIDRNDRLVLDMDQYDVWSTELVGDALYYVHLVNSPFASSLIERLQQVTRPEDGVDIEILRVDPDNSVTVIGTLHSEYPYVPCWITDGVLAVTEDKQDGSERLTTSYYDLQTLEPILPPDQKN